MYKILKLSIMYREKYKTIMYVNIYSKPFMYSNYFYFLKWIIYAINNLLFMYRVFFEKLNVIMYRVFRNIFMYHIYFFL